MHVYLYMYTFVYRHELQTYINHALLIHIMFTCRFTNTEVTKT